MNLQISAISIALLASSGAVAQLSEEIQALDTSSGGLICESVSPDFPYSHEYLRVNGVNLAYVDVGEGDPILLTHGNPTSSYLWRNVIPVLAEYGRVIAFDAAGHGKSEIPGNEYDFSDYIDSLEAFIEQMQLENVTLVMHDWLPGAAGFEYARLHEENVKGIAFMESVVGPRFPNAFGNISMPFQGFMRMAKTLEFQEAVLDGEVFPQNMQLDPCSIEEAAYAIYAAPLDRAHLRVIQAYPRLVPVGPDAEGEAAEIVQAYSDWMRSSSLPKLLILAEFGAIMDLESAGEIVKTVPNLSVVTVRSALHYIPETHPEKLGREISHWYREISR